MADGEDREGIAAEAAINERELIVEWLERWGNTLQYEHWTGSEAIRWAIQEIKAGRHHGR